MGGRVVTGPREWLEAELDRVEAAARGVGSWSVMPDGRAVSSDDHLIVAARHTVGHIALHGPDAVLRRIRADRALLADLDGEWHTVCSDPFYTCASATVEREGERNPSTRPSDGCDCGRDERVERRVRLIAEGWGWEAQG